MDYHTLLGIIAVLFGGTSEPVDSYAKITKNTIPAEVRIYKPINMDESIKFDVWSEAIKSTKNSK